MKKGPDLVTPHQHPLRKHQLRGGLRTTIINSQTHCKAKVAGIIPIPELISLSHVRKVQMKMPQDQLSCH